MQTATRPFASSREHILGELALLDLRLALAVRNSRQVQAGLPSDAFRGLMIDDAQVDSILHGQPPVGSPRNAEPGPLFDELLRRQQELADAKQDALESGVDLRLEQLRQLFGLDDWEIQVVVLCLAPELERRYETLYGYLQDDVGKKRPTVGLALTLFTSNWGETVDRRSSFLYPAPLVRHGLVGLQDDPYSKGATLLGHFLRLDQRVAEYLLNSDVPDPRLAPFASLVEPATTWDDLILPSGTKASLVCLADNLASSDAAKRNVLLQLLGSEGTGKKLVSQALCRSLGRRLLLVSLKKLIGSEIPSTQLIDLVIREAQLQEAVLCWDDWDSLQTDVQADDATAQATREAIVDRLSKISDLTIVTSQAAWRPPRHLPGLSLVTVQLPRPDYSARKLLWSEQLAERQESLNDDQLSSLATKFRLSGGQIQRSVATAVDAVRWRSTDRPADQKLSPEDLYAAARWHSSQKLAALAQKVEPQYSWNDLVLPADPKSQLAEISGYFQHMPLVYEEWGFQRKTSQGKGMNVLFAGPSGTGKTMSAQIIAGELGLDLYRIDLSTVVSKYIGETEKNLDRIFREAEDSNSILFFDEADALFGKRSEVRDSHDRYANIEISYLLQKMEEYQGIVILATNFRKNIDDAFVRRLHFAVEFPFPDEEHRLQIWQKVFPEEAPLGQDADLELLARQFKVSGGNIKNIGVTSAFLAAQDGQVIKMEHLIRATKREYQKMGKLLVESDFGSYFDLVKG